MRIAVVNHLPTVAEALQRALDLEPGHRIVWTAQSGAAAVEQCRRDKPDLVLMDLFLAGIDGVEATRRIMAATPCAILIVTEGLSTHAARVFEAMGHGAIDAVDLPCLDSVPEPAAVRARWQPLLAKIDAVAALLKPPASRRRGGRRGGASGAHRLAAVGASAGGPAALARLLAELPGDFPAPIVVVQHVDPQFALGMARWLDQQVALRVRLACENDRPRAGEVLLAGTSDHLVFKSEDRLGYTAEPVECVYRPSVDAFFNSICAYWRGEAVGILLTGMGRDGALGLKAMRNRGWHTIAQDQASSAVYGMPKAAVRVDAAVEILPLDRIASRLVSMAASNQGVGA